MSLKETVRLRLIAVREALEIPQAKYAEELGIGQSTYALIETGDTRPSLDIIDSIAEIYHVNKAWILGFSEDVFTNEAVNKLVAPRVIKALNNPVSKRRGGKKKTATTSRRDGNKPK